MLDISQARRLSTIARNRMAAQEELEDEIQFDWEARAVELMADPELIDFLCDFVDEGLRGAANHGDNSIVITAITRTWRGERQHGISMSSDNYSSYNLFAANYDDIASIFAKYDFMDVSAQDDVFEILCAMFQNIIAPLYEEQGYSVWVDDDVDGSYHHATVTIQW